DRNAVLGARFAAIKHLHTLLRSPEAAVSNEAIIVAVKLAFNDLCFGQASELLLHIDGAREMVRARGGLTALAATPHLAKMVLVEPPLHTSRSLPTIHPAPKQSHRPSCLTTNPTTSALLKDTAFLLDTVLALPSNPSPWELQKVQSMSSWVEGRLSSSSLAPSHGGSHHNTHYHFHQAIRMSSLFYCRAIHARRPLSEVVTEQDIAELVRSINHVPLDLWEKDVEGIGGEKTPMPTQESHVARTMVVAGVVELALRDWEAVVRVSGRIVRLQTWLSFGAKS
ncbi:uncharacterized protein C8A04DRAFT_13430, partial [Dichotomopilus funicola]